MYMATRYNGLRHSKLNYTTPTNNNQRISSNTRNRQIAQSVLFKGQTEPVADMVGSLLVGKSVLDTSESGCSEYGNRMAQIGVQNIGIGNVVAVRG
ncbi:hypothetical protein Tco_0172640 [Tanacetum coccineum]